MKKKPKYKTFSGLLRAYKAGKIDKSRLELVCWTSNCAVTISLCGDPVIEDGEVVDRKPSTLLLRCDTSDLFAFEVIEALGGQGRQA